MVKPLVSIVIPVYNREQYIADCIQSALDQTIKNLEVVIVDNCSTDNTLGICKGIAEKDGRVRVYENESNIGPVRNWIKVIELAQADLIKILWSDDLISETFIEKTHTRLLSDETVGFVMTSAVVFDDVTNVRETAYVIGKSGYYPVGYYVEGVLLGKSLPYSPGCALFRKKDIKKNLLLNIPNKINSDFSMHAIGNDLLIFLLTTIDYEKFYYINEPLSYFRSHSSSISTSSNKARLLLLYLVAKAYFLENYVSDKKLIKKFNSILALTLNKYPQNDLGIRQIEDFYLATDSAQFDKLYYIINYIKKIILPALFKKIGYSSH